MRTIIKKISLENFKSRTPSSISSLKTVWEIPSLNSGIFYTYSDALEYAVRYGVGKKSIISYEKFVDVIDENGKINISNYGLVVSDIEITNLINEFGITDYTDIYVNIKTLENSYERVVNGNEFYPINNFSIDDLVEIKNNYNDNKGAYVFEYYFYYGRDIYYINDYKLSIINVNSINNVEDIIEHATKKKYITYSTLKKWYAFFKEYKESLRIPNTDLYYESFEKMYYSSPDNSEYTLDYCLEMDEIYKSRGGDGFYDYINNTLFIKFNIPTQFSKNWKVKFLPYPKALEMAGWFKEMHEKFVDYDSNLNCIGDEDCCECQEFFKLGGHEMYNAITAWVNSVRTETVSIKSCSAVIPLLFQRNIEDCGEMSIFSKRWETNVNYSSKFEGDSRNGGTIVISPNNNSAIISGGSSISSSSNYKGYTFDEEYKEVKFKDDDWGDYTGIYMNSHQNEFATSITSFSFNHDDKMIYNPTDEKMEVVRNLSNNIYGYFSINDTIYDVEVKNYVIYESNNEDSTINGKIFPVNKTFNGTYYVNINGRKYFPIKINNSYYFNFNDNNICQVKSSYTSKMYGETRMVIYDDNVYLLEYDNKIGSDIITIDNGFSTIKYQKILYYFIEDVVTYYIVGNNENMIISDGYILTRDEDNDCFYTTFNEVTDVWVCNSYYPYFNTKTVHLLYKYDLHLCSIISGNTDSKLSSIRSLKLLTDDNNNVLPGYYDFTPNKETEREWVLNGMIESQRTNSKNSTPYDGMQLDLYYKVGNVSNLSLNESLTENGNPFKKYYNGNIIDNMKFYFTNISDGSICTDTLVEMSNSMFSNGNYVMVYNKSYDRDYSYIGRKDTLKAIGLCRTLRDNYTNKDLVDDKIYCKIEYYIDAIIHEVVTTAVSEYDESILYNFDSYELEKNDIKTSFKYHYGIKYIDTVELKENLCEYMLYNGTVYYLKFFEFVYPMRFFSINGKIKLEQTSSEFFMPILLYLYGEDEINKVHPYYDKGNGFDERNNLDVYPLFRHDYQIGISTPQNVNSDIYIDRGIHKAFDKHIRLQEINTMEALENYSNGLFKITEY